MVLADEIVYGRQIKTLSDEIYRKKMGMAPNTTDLIAHADEERKAPDKKNHKEFLDTFLNYRGMGGIDDVIRIGEKMVIPYFMT